MTRKYDNSRRNKWKLLGICSKCKINPLPLENKYKRIICNQCHAEYTLARYNAMKNGYVSKTGKSIETWLLNMYKVNAAKRNIQFNLTDEQAIEIMHKPCKYCKLPKAMGIDRIDSKSDYTPETVVPCCGNCNRAKHTQTAEQYNEWLQGTVDRLKSC